MLPKTRCCMALVRPAIATILPNLKQATSMRSAQPIICNQLPHLRHKHETIFENLFEPPIDHSKVQIDEVIKSLGERGIQRDEKEVKLQDMFKLFQLEERFVINDGKLHREMLKLQRALHPDKYLRTDKTSQVVSDKLSAIVNEAFETLKNPYKRALYLLRIKAGKTEIEVEKSLDNLKVEQDFLNKMMNIREKIDSNSGGRPEQMKLFMELQSDLDALVLATNRYFEHQDYDSVLSNLGYIKFLANCHAALADKVGDFSNY